jgi:hypothetical protein
MPVEISHDPREILVRRKYFSLRPQPLEQWIWKQGIAPSAERVFWLHWQEGMRNRDWCSSIPLRRVAVLCSLDVSSVTRAYQALIKLGLIRREDPGRDPSKPFEQSVAVTEVRVPRELLCELTRHPDRRFNDRVETAGSQSPSPDLKPIEAIASTQIRRDPFVGKSSRERQREMGELLNRLSAKERSRYHEAFRTRQPHLEFDPQTTVDAQGRGSLLRLLELAAAAPAAQGGPPASPRPTASAGPRKLNVLELARLRRDLCMISGSERSHELLRQVVWAVEQGALARFTPLHAMRIAVKKIREGAWTRPNRMPPNWLIERAQAELCRTA